MESPNGGQRPRRRAALACHICRQQRRKCIHEGSKPCQACVDANTESECTYPKRGEVNQARQYRHPRQRRSDRGSRSSSRHLPRNSMRGSGGHYGIDEYRFAVDTMQRLLPDTNTIMIGVDAFFRRFNQLSFLHNDLFAHSVRENAHRISPFLLCSILAVSARHVKTLRDAYGGVGNIVHELTDRAERAGKLEMFQEPTLEKCQAFFLLSIAQQSCGRVQAGNLSAGLALSVAVSLGLHREETLVEIMCDATLPTRIHAEIARRTFWYIYYLNKSLSGPRRPVALSPHDISTYSLNDEGAFDTRVGLSACKGHDAPMILRPPSLASYLHILDIWGTVARLAVNKDLSQNASKANGDFVELTQRLEHWDKSRPLDQAYAGSLLPGYRNQCLDLAYLDINATFRLCQVVLRKPYLNDVAQYSRSAASNEEIEAFRGLMKDLFAEVRHLFQILDARFEHEPLEEKVGSALTCFALYAVGTMATYLYKCPHVDARVETGSSVALDQTRGEGLRMYSRVCRILQACQEVWPAAGHWQMDLERWHTDFDAQLIGLRISTALGKPTPSAAIANHFDNQQFRSSPLLPSIYPHVGRGENSSRHYESSPQPPRLPPLHGTRGPPKTQPLSIPPLARDPFQPAGPPPRLSPSVLPPSSAPLTHTVSPRGSYFPTQPQSKYNHMQVVLDHRPSPQPSTGPSHVRTPGQLDGCASEIANLNITPDSRATHPYSRTPSTSSAPPHHSTYSYHGYANTSPDPRGSISEASQVSCRNDDGFERNLEEFLQTGATWSAAAGAHTRVGRHTYSYSESYPHGYSAAPTSQDRSSISPGRGSSVGSSVS